MIIRTCVLTFDTDFENDSWFELINKEPTDLMHLGPAFSPHHISEG